MRLSLFLAFLLAAFSVKAQPSFVGDWTGALEAGMTLHIDFHITQQADRLAATMDSPDQGVAGIQCGRVIVKDDSITIMIPKIYGFYKGELKDGKITGIWQQMNNSLPLELTKGTTGAPKRPQTPQPPFDYKSEDVLYYNADSTQRFGATITTPNGKGPFPALLLITGSGPENRDEEIALHKPFAVIADYLTKRGYIVMRVDDRGVGQSTGDAINGTTADFVKDVNISLNYLKKRKEVNTKKLGLLGHSEGGIIAPMVADERNDVDFIILLAAPGIPVKALMREQLAAVMRSTGVTENAVNEFGKLYGKLEDIVLENKSYTEMEQAMKHAVTQWKAQTPDSIVQETTGIKDDAGVNDFATKFARQCNSKWYRYFLSIDPALYLKKLHCKVLALNGSKDVQVIATPDLDGIKIALAEGKVKDYKVEELPGLNHLFQHCNKCTIQEYGELEETFSPGALQIIGDWLDKEVK